MSTPNSFQKNAATAFPLDNSKKPATIDTYDNTPPPPVEPPKV